MSAGDYSACSGLDNDVVIGAFSHQMNRRLYSSRRVSQMRISRHFARIAWHRRPALDDLD
jgi:hypothetical protein